MRRIEKGLSQAELGDALGVSFQQIQKYEKGVNRVGGGRVQEVAIALDVAVAYFYEGAPGSAKTKPAPGAADVSSFMTSPDGVVIAQAYQRLPVDGKQRRIVRDLIVSIVDAHTAMTAKAPQRRAA
jgi:transcriptional regulator with XRE-family HTH domain